MDPIYHAQRGNVEFFKTVSKELLRNAISAVNGCSALDYAAMLNKQDCVTEICRKCPELVYYQGNEHNMTALMYAACAGYLIIVTCIVDTANKVGLGKDDIVGEGAKKLLRMLDEGKRSALEWAVERQKFEVTKFLLEAAPDLEYGQNEIAETPLMVATRKAREINNPVQVKIRDLLLENQQWQHKVRIKEHRWTPLQKAASKGDLDAVKEIIQSNPKQTELVNDEKRNFVHLAAKFGRTEIIKFVMEEADISSCVSNAQDIDGNTPLHIAALYGNQSTTSCLLYDDRIIKRTVNTKGQKALDLVTFEVDGEKAKDKDYSAWS